MTESWKGFREGDIVEMINPSKGDDSEGVTRTYRKGTLARVDGIEDFGPVQGRGVHLTIGGDAMEEAGKAICNSIDEHDVREKGVPFRKHRG